MVTAQEAMQAEIVWNVDPKARCEILQNAKVGECSYSPERSDPLQFLGVDVVVDPTLPLNQVVLKAGERTLGAFTIGLTQEELKQAGQKGACDGQYLGG